MSAGAYVIVFEEHVGVNDLAADDVGHLVEYRVLQHTALPHRVLIEIWFEDELRRGDGQHTSDLKQKINFVSGIIDVYRVLLSLSAASWTCR